MLNYISAARNTRLNCFKCTFFPFHRNGWSIFMKLRIFLFICSLSYSSFPQKNGEYFLAFAYAVFLCRWRTLSIYAWLRLKGNVPDRCHISTSCCFDCYQFIGSPSYYPVKRAGYRNRGNKAPTAIKLKRACGGAGGYRLAKWAG